MKTEKLQLNMPDVISNYLEIVSEKTKIPIDRIVCGVMNNEFYLWDYDSGREFSKHFKVIKTFKINKP